METDRTPLVSGIEPEIDLRAPVFSEPPKSALVADVYEDGDCYVIQIPVPGLKPGEIDVKANGYSLTVSTRPAESEPRPGRNYIIREHSILPLARTFNFPFEIDKGKVSATLNYGMLVISVPKPECGAGKTTSGKDAVS